MSREYIDALNDSLKKKLRILDEIYRMCLEQSELLSKETLDYEAFDRLVNDKDICIEKLDKLDEGFEIVYAHVSEELKAGKDAYAEIIRQMQESISQITERGTSIEALEKRNKDALDKALNRDRKSLSESKRSVNVAMHYYKNMAGLNVPDSRFLDKKK